jgi:hypothetical protein
LEVHEGVLTVNESSSGRHPEQHESPLRWLEDVASIFAGKRVGLEATLLLYLLATAAVVGIIWTAVHQ